MSHAEMRHAAVTALGAALLSGGCAVFAGGSGSDVGSADPGAAAVDTVVLPPDTARVRSPGSTSDRLAAGDYPGVLAAYAADPDLQAEEEATFHAAIAAAMGGHPRHDPRMAVALFGRLLEQHPDSPRRPAVVLVLDLLTRQRELRAANERLDRELQQLKAIDLGQAPVDSD